MHNPGPAIFTGVCVLGLLLAPLALGSFSLYVLSMWAIMALSAIGLNIPLGLGAIYSFGHGAFMLIGAYGTAVGMARWGLPFIPALIMSVALAAAIGAVIGLLALRLSGFALAIVTFSFGFVLFDLVKGFDLTGGPQGMAIPDTQLSGKLWGNGLYYLTVVCFLGGLAMFVSLSGSKTGRALRTLGESIIVARSLGIDPERYKLAAFMLSACYAALAGGLLAVVTGFVSPDSFAPQLSIDIFAAVIIGGAGTVLGPLLGAFFVVVIPELTQSVQNLAQIIYAALFCLSVTLYPGGMVGFIRSLTMLGRKITTPLPAA